MIQGEFGRFIRRAKSRYDFHELHPGDRRKKVRADELRLPVGDRRRLVFAANLEPCLMCLGAAMSAMVGTVLYALDSPSDGAVALAGGWDRRAGDFPAYRLPAIRGGILAEASRALFAEYVRRFPDRGGFTAWAATLAD